MKKLLFLIGIITLMFSCKKSNSPTIHGKWSAYAFAVDLNANNQIDYFETQPSSYVINDVYFRKDGTYMNVIEPRLAYTTDTLLARYTLSDDNKTLTLYTMDGSASITEEIEELSSERMRITGIDTVNGSSYRYWTLYKR